MKADRLKVRGAKFCAAGLGSLLLAGGATPLHSAPAPFGVPVRLSFKFFLNPAGNRPATGELNTDAEIEAQVARGNQILSSWTSELRLHLVEIVDLAGLPQWYNGVLDDRDDIRSAAIAKPSAYAWRTNAINIYIVSSDCSARAKFPPDNDIILICQSIFNTTVVHEVGHSLNLLHTHEDGGADGCSDTLPDNDDWNRDQISNNAYGKVYELLTSAQQYNVNMVWSNLMSYHNGDHRSMISPCQMDRMSDQASTDQSWLLTKRPVYVDPSAGVIQSGTFSLPYQTIQNAINSGTLNNRVLVLEEGTHAAPSGAITTATDVVPRKGIATVREPKLPYDLPTNLEESRDPNVRQAILQAQVADRQKDIEGVITNLLAAEKFATARERDAIRLELAQRYRDSGRLEEAAVWFDRAAAGTDQPGLRRRSLEKVQAVREEAERRRKEKQQAQEAQAREKPADNN